MKIKTIIALLTITFTSTLLHAANELWRAVAYNDKAKVLELLEANKNVPHYADGNQLLDYWIPLDFALFRQNTDIAQILLDYGADINKLNIISGDSILSGMIVEDRATYKNIDMIKFLLERGANPNIGKSNPLYHVAACLNTTLTLPTTYLLLDYGADPNQKNANGWTSLEVAQLRNNTTFIKAVEDWKKAHKGQIMQRVAKRMGEIDYGKIIGFKFE